MSRLRGETDQTTLVQFLRGLQHGLGPGCRRKRAWWMWQRRLYLSLMAGARSGRRYSAKQAGNRHQRFLVVYGDLRDTLTAGKSGIVPSRYFHQDLKESFCRQIRNH